MLSNEILCKNNEYTYINETILSDVFQNSTIYLQSMKKMLGTLATLPSKISFEQSRQVNLHPLI